MWAAHDQIYWACAQQQNGGSNKSSQALSASAHDYIVPSPGLPLSAILTQQKISERKACMVKLITRLSGNLMNVGAVQLHHGNLMTSIKIHPRIN